MYKIMIIEDDLVMAEAIAKEMNAWGNEAVYVKNFQNVLSFFAAQAPHLVLMDITLPFYNGYHWCSEIRRVSKLPIMFLSSASDNMNIVMAMNMGADDFISKPFDINEVLARVEAQLRRYKAFSSSKTNSNNKLTHKNLTLDIDSRQVQVNGININLTVREFDILELLISNPNKVFTRANLFEAVWKDEFIGDYNTVNVHISNLRAKISKIDKENEYIQTVWGIGFKLKSE